MRAIGDLTDPVLVGDKIEAGRGDSRIAERLAILTEKADPRVTLEALTVFRRLHWGKAPEWISEHLTAEDPALDHAAQQALRHSRNWPAVMGLLDQSPRLRTLALQATAEQRVSYVATQFIERLATSDNPEHRREYTDALARVVRKEKPWTYWGFRPAPRSAAPIDWEKTTEIVAALNATSADESHEVRAFALQRMQREGVTPELTRLGAWLRDETNEGRVTRILAALKSADASKTQPILREVVLRQNLPDANRLAALSAFVAELPSDDVDSLRSFGAKLEDGPVLASALRQLGNRPKLDASDLLLAKLGSSSADVRAAAIRSLGLRKSPVARDHVVKLLDDESVDVRQAAAETAGLLDIGSAADKLVVFSKGEELELVRASLVSLRQLKDARVRAPAVAALQHSETQVAALRYLRESGTPDLTDSVAEIAATNPAIEFHREVAETLNAWLKHFPDSFGKIEKTLATVHGQSGQPLLWQTTGPLAEAVAKTLLAELTQGEVSLQRDLVADKIDSQIVESDNGAIQFKRSSGSDAESVWLAWTLVAVAEKTEIEMLASAAGNLSVWLDKDQVYNRDKPATFRPDSDRFATTLATGTRLIVVEVRPNGKPARFHLRFRRRSSKAEHEKLSQFALQSRGNSSRGREVFDDIKKSSCLQCHRLGETGGKIGPDMAGIGSRFSRIHLIESILEPSRTVAPSYATIVVVLNDGRVLTGVRISEDTDMLLLGDNQGKTHEIPKADIDELSPQKLSTMPEGLEKKLTNQEFVDLLAFLESQKKSNE
ncbi:MAG: hypothetical protein CMJ64_14830 [Planctomycetaceae bacterium]|nr:hypothetical protein [Planctomycetaceae bacterium]